MLWGFVNGFMGMRYCTRRRRTACRQAKTNRNKHPIKRLFYHQTKPCISKDSPTDSPALQTSRSADLNQHLPKPPQRTVGGAAIKSTCGISANQIDPHSSPWSKLPQNRLQIYHVTGLSHKPRQAHEAENLIQRQDQPAYRCAPLCQ